MSDAEGVRLQKVLSQAGIASRRVAERMIIDGRVEVDGRVVTELGTRVDPDACQIRVDGARVVLDDSMVYLAINKPIGMHSTMSDDRGRPCIGDLVEHRVRGNRNLFHVGRLDADTEGLLLLTNDGELAHRLMHPSYEVPKTYLATVAGSIPRGLGKTLRAGIELEDGPELEVTGPSRIYNASQTRGMLGGGNTAELVAEIRALRAEVEGLRHEARATATNTGKTAKSLDGVINGADSLNTVAIA